jgi:hypothetical protein
MTVEQVLSAFGEPGNQLGRRTEECVFRYLAPLGGRTGERDGYIGFEVQFNYGRVVGWRTFRGEHAYEPPQVPPQLKWFGEFYLLLSSLVFIWITRRKWKKGSSDGALLLRAFNEREIATERIPAEFRFITHDITLKDVIDRVGQPTRVMAMPVSPRLVKGSRLVEDAKGKPAIMVAVYGLPNSGAVIVIPEYPFERENRIRTAYYLEPLHVWNA